MKVGFIKYSATNMSLGSADLRIVTVVLLLSARIRLPTHNSIVGILRKRYGQNLVKEVRALQKLDFDYRKASLNVGFLIYFRSNNVIPKSLYLKVSNTQLRS